MENQISIESSTFSIDLRIKISLSKEKQRLCLQEVKFESPPLPASKKQSNEIHRNRLLLLLGYKSFTAVHVSFIHTLPTFIHSFVYSFFNQSFIHSKINCEGQEHLGLICCKLIRYCQVDRANNRLSSGVGFIFPPDQANIWLFVLAETTFVIL